MDITRDELIKAMADGDYVNWPFGFDKWAATDRYGEMADAVLDLIERKKGK